MSFCSPVQRLTRAFVARHSCQRVFKNPAQSPGGHVRSGATEIVGGEFQAFVEISGSPTDKGLENVEIVPGDDRPVIELLDFLQEDLFGIRERQRPARVGTMIEHQQSGLHA
jgi:hypothetical protein